MQMEHRYPVQVYFYVIQHLLITPSFRTKKIIQRQMKMVNSHLTKSYLETMKLLPASVWKW